MISGCAVGAAAAAGVGQANSCAGVQCWRGASSIAVPLSRARSGLIGIRRTSTTNNDADIELRAACLLQLCENGKRLPAGVRSALAFSSALLFAFLHR